MTEKDYKRATLACVLHDIHGAFNFAHDLLCKWHVDYIDAQTVRNICLSLIELQDKFLHEYGDQF